MGSSYWNWGIKPNVDITVNWNIFGLLHTMTPCGLEFDRHLDSTICMITLGSGLLWKTEVHMSLLEARSAYDQIFVSQWQYCSPSFAYSKIIKNHYFPTRLIQFSHKRLDSNILYLNEFHANSVLTSAQLFCTYQKDCYELYAARRSAAGCMLIGIVWLKRKRFWFFSVNVNWNLFYHFY